MTNKTISDCLKELDLYQEYIKVKIPLDWAKETGVCRNAQYPKAFSKVYLFPTQIPTFDEFRGDNYKFWSTSKNYLGTIINHHLWQ